MPPLEAAHGGPAIRVEGLSHRYGERQALRGIDLEVKQGEIFALLGPNGGGKTTLFRILSTYLMPTGGTARVHGHDVVREPEEVRRRLGVLFQSPSLDAQLTVRENLRYHGLLFGLKGGELKRRIDESLAQVRLSDRAGERVGRLSGGLQRRAELAQAMLHHPRVLLLDEPATGLDPGARADLANYLDRLRAETHVTVLLTTHLMDEADGADRLAILDGGRIVGAGTPRELKEALGGDVIELEGPDPGALHREIGRLYGDSVSLVDGVVHLEQPRGRETLARLLPALTARIDSALLRHPTLEDVFLARTGRHFHHDDEPEAGGA
jgi:ABC-2 type transport system ATP-binding protein